MQFLSQEIGKTTLAVKVDYKIAEKLREFCRERGIKGGFFAEKALEERLEREEFKEDLQDQKTLRVLEKDAVPIKDYRKSDVYDILLLTTAQKTSIILAEKPSSQ